MSALTRIAHTSCRAALAFALARAPSLVMKSAKPSYSLATSGPAPVRCFSLLAAVVAGGAVENAQRFPGGVGGCRRMGGGGSLPHPGRPPVGVMGVRGKRGRFPQDGRRQTTPSKPSDTPRRLSILSRLALLLELGGTEISERRV